MIAGAASLQVEQRTEPWPACKGTPPSIEWLGVDRLQIDRSYQRAIDNPQSRNLIRRIAEAWDWDLCGVLIVSRRSEPEGLFVMDGQHRLEAARMRGDIPHLPAVVVRLPDRVDEAKFFVAANTARKQPTPLDRFNARCVAGDERAMRIRALIEAHGLTVAKSNYRMGKGEIACVAVLDRLFAKYKENHLSGALAVITKAWPNERYGAQNEMLPGICGVLASANETFDLDRFIRVVASCDQVDWVLRANRKENLDLRMRTEGAMAAVLREAYDEAEPNEIDAPAEVVEGDDEDDGAVMRPAPADDINTNGVTIVFEAENETVGFGGKEIEVTTRQAKFVAALAAEMPAEQSIDAVMRRMWGPQPPDRAEAVLEQIWRDLSGPLSEIGLDLRKGRRGYGLSSMNAEQH